MKADRSSLSYQINKYLKTHEATQKHLDGREITDTMEFPGDSLDFLEFIMHFEELYEIEIDDKQVEYMSGMNVGDIKHEFYLLLDL